ncbi:MAG TPA: hypothetical protein VNU22_13155, partial [Candidatus Acidoferrum sp.]|nr:hypothetical protein [Candidatus Acidoferrum sp.]
MKSFASTATWGGSLGILLLIAITLAFPRRYELGPPWEEPAFTVTLVAVFLVSAIANLAHGSGLVKNAAILTVVGATSVYNALSLFMLVLFL